MTQQPPPPRPTCWPPPSPVPTWHTTHGGLNQAPSSPRADRTPPSRIHGQPDLPLISFSTKLPRPQNATEFPFSLPSFVRAKSTETEHPPSSPWHPDAFCPLRRLGPPSGMPESKSRSLPFPSTGARHLEGGLLPVSVEPYRPLPSPMLRVLTDAAATHLIGSLSAKHPATPFSRHPNIEPPLR
jgi:hypothetical protein